VSTWKPYFKARKQEQETLAQREGTAYGYYLVRASDNQRFFISKTVCLLSLGEVAEKVLSDKHGWDYWIDKSSGTDVDGRAAWSNVDFTDRFV